MEEAALERKRKLQAIREKSKSRKVESVSASESDDKDKNKSIRFRNHQPRDASLKAFIDKPKENTEENSKNELPSTEGDVIKNELRQYGADKELNVLPKNNNWDLKKQLEPKLEKLRRRTQRAIVEILREKIAQESDSEDDVNT